MGLLSTFMFNRESTFRDGRTFERSMIMVFLAWHFHKNIKVWFPSKSGGGEYFSGTIEELNFEGNSITFTFLASDGSQRQAGLDPSRAFRNAIDMQSEQDLSEFVGVGPSVGMNHLFGDLDKEYEEILKVVPKK